MNKKFLFVNLSIECGFNSGVNHGIAYLAPVAKKHAYETACLNIRREISAEEFAKEIDEFNPDIVGFSSVSNQLKYLLKYSKELQKRPEILQIAGGIGSTLDPDFVLSKSPVSAACVGEGEIPLDNLLCNIKSGKDISETKGFYWRTPSSGIKKNPIPQYASDISTIDFPDYSIYDRNAVTFQGNLIVVLSRGCPYNCSYCCNKALKSVYPSHSGYFRVPSVEYCIKLLEGLTKQYPEIEFIEFEDDLLIANNAWFRDFASEYKKRVDLPYKMCVRVECITKDIANALKVSGCREVLLGLESGNEELRANLLNRKYSNKLLIEKCKIIKDAGLGLFTFNIVGFPFEKRSQMQETFELNKTIVPNAGGICTFFYPFKGTELYNICKENNLLKNNNDTLKITNYNTGPCIKMDRTQEKDSIYFQKKISYYFYRQHSQRITSHLGPGLKKLIPLMYCWVKFILWRNPALYRAVGRLYRLLGIKAFMVQQEKRMTLRRRKQNNA